MKKLIKLFLTIMFLVPFGLAALAIDTNLPADKITKVLPKLESSKKEKRSIDLDHRALNSGVNNYLASIDENRSVDLDHRNLNFSVNGSYLEDTNISLGMKTNGKNRLNLSTTSYPEQETSSLNVDSLNSSAETRHVTMPFLE